jgi:hypothetical protein
MRQANSLRIVAAALLALALLASCGPEDGRARGGGPGGDANNKPAQIQPRSKVFVGEDHP